MLKKFLPAVLLAFTYLASNASAAVIYLGNGSGNDDINAVKAIILSATAVDANISLYDKTDDGTLLTTLTGGTTSGGWDVLNDSILIAYITVKAGPNFAVYQIDPAANSGTWTTATLMNAKGVAHDLSHMSLWTVPTTREEVPEPSTMITMAAAGIGLLAFRKFRA